jgi:hypothetical protein
MNVYLFNKEECEKLIARINCLHPDSKALWDKMTVSQMLLHSQKPMQIAFGEATIKRNIFGMLFGRIAKKTLVNDSPFSKNLPTAPSFVVRDEPDFYAERDKLIALIRRFHTGGPGALSKKPHGFFGPMSTMDWAKSNWKHLDHHLRQFGV